MISELHLHLVPHGTPQGYIRVMIAYLPRSLRGLMVAAFAAAYMSTIATQLNWGASYIVNEFYRRFLNPKATDHHYVVVAQLATILLTLVSAGVTFYMDSISGTWKLLIGTGTGSVLLFRWYWWRISAWSEVSAIISAFVVSSILEFGYHLNTMMITVGITTVQWLSTTFLTKPERQDVLIAFYRRTRPSVAGWGTI